MPLRARLPASLIPCLALIGASVLPVATAQAPGREVPVYSYRVVARYPHDAGAFTQGLIFKDGFLYESTGMYGRSSVRKVRLADGKVLEKTDLPASVFGEGLTDRGQQLLVLTWTTQTGYIVKLPGLAVTGNFAYPGEGWGLARSADTIYMSDGTAQIRLLDPKSLRERSRIRVTFNGKPLPQLNELEWVDGELFANVWMTDSIVRIDPNSGRVVGRIDLGGLLARHGTRARGADVLNGIAYDGARKRLFVTGKLWPDLFEIELVPPASRAAKPR
ncbi:glutaminyl-peptide cyclotransferase [Lysobacter sp. Hz 25]|uniref:glutaminyl-peptide cyclotransferase n=1 Tax=Lysobacter sp. Hz 25 TaxID=3383698 RepID=UPI0038D3C423